MNKAYAALVAVAIAGTLLLGANAATPATRPQFLLETKDLTTTAAQSVINRAIGSGSVDLGRGEELLTNARTSTVGASKAWLDAHPDLKIFGGVPFYGPRNLPVGFEYYVQCGDDICGAFYEAFPNVAGMDQAFDLFRK